MDALEIIKQINNYKKKVEKMDAPNAQPKAGVDDNMMNIGTIISMVIGIYAAYLSYECNTKKNIPEMSKIIFAVLAYIFGLFYLAYYYLFQYDTCLNL
jgi:hypothetical protein